MWRNRGAAIWFGMDGLPGPWASPRSRGWCLPAIGAFL